jgi:hypothetical protein
MNPRGSPRYYREVTKGLTTAKGKVVLVERSTIETPRKPWQRRL